MHASTKPSQEAQLDLVSRCGWLVQRMAPKRKASDITDAGPSSAGVGSRVEGSSAQNGVAEELRKDKGVQEPSGGTPNAQSQSAKSAKDDDTVEIHFKYQAVQAEEDPLVTYKVKARVQLSKIFEKFCSKMGLEMSSTRFQVDGKKVDGKKTVAQAKLKSNVVIDVLVQQQGGAAEV